MPAAHLFQAASRLVALAWLAVLAFSVVAKIGEPLTCSADEYFGLVPAVTLVLGILACAAAGAVLARRTSP